MTQNKFKEDINITRELAKVLCENELVELEFNKVLSKESSLSIKIKKGLNHNELASLSMPNQKVSPPRVEKEDKKITNEDEIKNSLGYLRSPMVGTVYLSPEPNSDPFVKVGDIVKEGQPMLIIEAMKTMNHIPANKAGTIKNILVENGTPVEFGDPLILIE